MEEIFDAVSYQKGSCVIRMLYEHMGHQVSILNCSCYLPLPLILPLLLLLLITTPASIMHFSVLGQNLEFFCLLVHELQGELFKGELLCDHAFFSLYSFSSLSNSLTFHEQSSTVRTLAFTIKHIIKSPSSAIVGDLMQTLSLVTFSSASCFSPLPPQIH